MGGNDEIYVFAIDYNKLTSLDFNTSGSSLSILSCSNNEISNLSLSSSLRTIETMNCKNNSISNLAINNLFVRSLDVSENSGIYVVIYGYGKIENLFINDCDLNSLDMDNLKEGMISLECNNNNITELNNINDLYTLQCSNNKLNTIDISSDSKISTLYCDNNLITSIDVLPKRLNVLKCSNNKITSIDLENLNNWDLNYFNCKNNKLTNLNLERFSALSTVDCSFNELTSLKITNQSFGNPINRLYCNDNKLTELDLRNIYIDEYAHPRPLDLRNNPNLGCVYVSNKSYYEGRFTSIDPNSHYVLDEYECDSWNTFVEIPDSKFENELIRQSIDDVADGQVLKHNIMNITELNVSNLKISDLSGIEEFDNLEELTFSRNYISSIDLSKNTKLKVLNCSMNPVLTSIDISNNIDLWSLSCYSTPINKLDVSNNINLRYLYCNDTDIEGLDLSKNTIIHELKVENCNLNFLDVRNNDFTQMIVFNATNNPNLRCIYVDDKVYCTNNFTDIDETATFVADESECSLLSLENIDIKSSIYPNPANNYFVVESPSKVLEVIIYDNLGREITSFIDGDIYEIGNIEPGIYNVIIQTVDGKGKNRLIIE